MLALASTRPDAATRISTVIVAAAVPMTAIDTVHARVVLRASHVPAVPVDSAPLVTVALHSYTAPAAEVGRTHWLAMFTVPPPVVARLA